MTKVNKIISLFLFLFLLVACTKKRNKTQKTPVINESLIKVKDLIWDLKQLQRVPNFEHIDSTSSVREIMFSVLDRNGKNTKVFAYYSNPDILKTGKNQGNKFPGVVLISGGNQPALKEWVERWAHEGYAAITCDYGNNRKMLHGGPSSSQAYIYDSIKQGPKAVRAYSTAVKAISAHSLLLSFPEVDKNKTAVTGISWGGFQTCIVSGIDNRFKAAAPIYGSAFHDEIVLDRKFFNRLSKENKTIWMNKIDPKNYLIYSQCPTLFISGNTDGCFDIEPFNKTTKLIPNKNRHISIIPGMGHDHPIGWKPREIAVFFNSIFKNGTPLAKITQIEKQDTSIRFGYESSLTIKKANFYYSNDTISSNEKRIWKSVPAKITEKYIESPVPNEGYTMGFLQIIDVMDLRISSELLIHR